MYAQIIALHSLCVKGHISVVLLSQFHGVGNRIPRLSLADQRRKVSTNEAPRRKKAALARLREMGADEKAGKLTAAERVKDTWAKILSAVF